MKKLFRRKFLPSLLLTVAIVFFMVSLIVFPDRYLKSTFSGICLWAVSVLPSLLVFFFLTQLLIHTDTIFAFCKLLSPISRKLFNCGGISAYVYVMSILSGYPIGAKLICDLYENDLITKDEATRMSTFCSTSGPLFIVGSVGISMFGSKKVGLLFLLIHILSSIFCGLIFRKYGDNRVIDRFFIKQSQTNNPLYDCIYSSVISVIIVGGFVAIFYTLSQILHDFRILLPFEKMLERFFGENASMGFVQGLIECTKGCKILSAEANTLSISLAVGLISFGGFSIICQSVIFLKKANVNIKIFLISKLIQMIFSIAVCYILLLII